MSKTQHSVIFVLGPTAVGKSALAERIAGEFNGSLLNLDSVQVYKHLDIGTAKPDPKTRDELPHLLFDFVESPDLLTAAGFRRRALKEIEAAIPNGPIIGVGGSGFYLRALEKGMFEVGPISNEIRQNLEELFQQIGGEGLYAELKKKDPETAERLNPNDVYRVTRALSIIFSEGRPLSEIRREFAKNHRPWPYRTLKIGLKLPRDVLEERVRERVELMLRLGWREEVEGLLARGLKDWAPMKSVGYKEMVAAIEGRLAWDELVAAVTMSTLKLAKKQMTWFRSDNDIKWFDAQGERDLAFAEAQRFLRG